MSDAITRPAHYARWKIEPIYFIMENNLPFDVGNVIKYVMRHDAKNGAEDLRKARRYLDMMILKAEGKATYADDPRPEVAGSPKKPALRGDIDGECGEFPG